MTHKCNKKTCGCQEIIESVLIAYDDNFIRITIPERVFRNHERIYLYLAQDIPPEIDANTTVIIEDGISGLAKLQLITRRGNLVYADSLKSRRGYLLRAATDTSTLVLEDISKLSATDHIFPTVPEAFPPRAPK